MAANDLPKPPDGVVRLHRQTKGRKGAGVTLIVGLGEGLGKGLGNGLGNELGQLKALAKWLKSQCGVGGSVKDGIIELQTADRPRIAQLLTSKGYRVKIAGG